MVSSGKPVVLEQRDDQGRAAEVPLPQSEEHDEIAAQLERMEKGDDNDEGTAGDDSKGREGTYYCLVYPLLHSMYPVQHHNFNPSGFHHLGPC